MQTNVTFVTGLNSLFHYLCLLLVGKIKIAVRQHGVIYVSQEIHLQNILRLERHGNVSALGSELRKCSIYGRQ